MGELVHALSMRLRESGERAALTIGAYFVALLLTAFAFAAFVYAAATALTAIYGPVVSALIVGAGAIVLAMIVFIWLGYRRKKLRRELRMRRLAQPAVAGVAASVLPMMVRASPIGTLLAVAAAAYVLQRSGQHRHPR